LKNGGTFAQRNPCFARKPGADILSARSRLRRSPLCRTQAVYQQPASQRPARIDRLLRHGLYPLLLGALLLYAALELSAPKEQLGRYYGYYLAGLVAVMLAVEVLHPLRAAWRMTGASFFRRDLPFLIIGGATIALANYAAGLAVIALGLARGATHADLPLLLGVILALVIPDFLWYWVHRWSHEGRGRVGRWLWKIHLAHHLPPQVYLLMHGVAHPLNTLIVRAILGVPLFFLGFSVEALFVANLFIGLQGLVSHFNVDLRAGWLNYFLVGTELHRYHHSADPAEARNYGAVVPLWDLLFGTFHYRPGQSPRALGVADPVAYPGDRQILRVLALPFLRPRSND
jgi:sterol desaturase/sphingolipid hydroxylase (fatty acid hydroxylase superfamily)